MQVMDLCRIESRQSLGEKIGLFLVIALQADPVARLQHGFEQGADVAGGDLFSLRQRRGARQPRIAVETLSVPDAHGRPFCVKVHQNSALTARKRTEGPSRQPKPVWN